MNNPASKQKLPRRSTAGKIAALLLLIVVAFQAALAAGCTVGRGHSGRIERGSPPGHASSRQRDHPGRSTPLWPSSQEHPSPPRLFGGGFSTQQQHVMVLATSSAIASERSSCPPAHRD